MSDYLCVLTVITRQIIPGDIQQYSAYQIYKEPVIKEEQINIFEIPGY